MRVVVDASRQGEVVLAILSEEGRLECRRHYDTVGMFTFTDCLLRYASDEGFGLLGSEVVIAVSGPVARDTVSIARTRWIISRKGLSLLLGRPPRIINDVSARAWAIRASTAGTRTLVGDSELTMAPGSRMIMVNVSEGVGGAIIDIDAGGVTTITGTEPGHAVFAAVDDLEMRLAQALGSPSKSATWEEMLMLRIGHAALAGLSQDAVDRMLAAILGRLVVGAVLNTGAWSGALLTGSIAAKLVLRNGATAFAAAFSRHGPMRRLVSDVPCWLASADQPVLAGCAAVFRFSGGGPADASELSQ